VAMKKFLLISLLIFLTVIAYADIRGEDIINFVKSQQKIKDYIALLQKRNESVPAIYIEDVVKNSKSIFVIIYVGEYFKKEEREVRMTTYYFDLKNEFLYELNVIDDTLTAIQKYKP
jgi:hypothetical protein